MNQYEELNATFRIDGYFHPTPSRDQGCLKKEFDRAKLECLGQLARQMKNIEEITEDQFFRATKKNVATAKEEYASTQF